ncbi:glutathione S-transferase 1-like [Branchiostoma floridae]|uniref:Glutathione S-transferase 1-like n=1 Tax=Branchiostoma floridae TaxID=7739 RepID=A0A9J7KUK5_BRAFL|nr:glutathione S-transferase 1-like [Branchiostoma floridae]
MGCGGSKNATVPSKGQKPSVDLYLALFSPSCRAVLMFAKEVGLELNHKLVDLQKGEARTPEFLAMNPCHCVPTIKDGGLTLWESAAIMVYLNDKYAKDPARLYPTDLQKRAKVNLMFGFHQNFDSSIASYMAPQILRGEEADPEKAEKVRTSLELFNKVLEGKTYVAGDCLTLPDFSLMASLTLLDFKDFDYKSNYPCIKAWNDRMRALPYFEETNKGWYDMMKPQSA